MVRLILFDIDGTLVRTGGAGVKAFRHVFATEFGAVDGFEQLKFSGRTDYGIVREFFNRHSIPATKSNFDRFFSRYVFWLDHILHESVCQHCPGILDFIHALKALAQPPVLGLLTGNIRLGAEIKLRHCNFWHYFVTGGFADDHEDRDQIAAVAKQRGSQYLNSPLHGNEVLVIGDTPLDIRCARAIGAKVLAVGSGGATLEELRTHKPDWLVPDVRGLPVAQIVGRLS